MGVESWHSNMRHKRFTSFPSVRITIEANNLNLIVNSLGKIITLLNNSSWKKYKKQHLKFISNKLGKSKKIHF